MTFEKCRAPLVETNIPTAAFHQSNADSLVTPVSNRLGLLPSGPDPVHRLTPHEIHAVTLMALHDEQVDPRRGIRPRCSGLRVQGTASSPSSTTVTILTDIAGFVNTQTPKDKGRTVLKIASRKGAKLERSKVEGADFFRRVQHPRCGADANRSSLLMLTAELQTRLRNKQQKCSEAGLCPAGVTNIFIGIGAGKPAVGLLTENCTLITDY